MNALILLTVFAVLQNIDNFILAAAYRWQSIEIPRRANWVIAILSGLFTGGAVLAAHFVQYRPIGAGFDKYTELFGRGILVMLGLWTIVGYVYVKWLDPVRGLSLRKGPAACSRIPSKMKLPEACVLGFALAVDNVGPAFAFGLVTRDIPFAGLTLSAVTGAVSLAAVAAGQATGEKGQQWKWLPPKLVAGFLILGIAAFDPGDLLNWIAFSGLR